MALGVASLFPPPPFEGDKTGGGSNTVRWTNWLRKFNIYMVATGITDPKVAVNSFLHIAGDQVEDVFERTKVANSGDSLASATALITAYYTPTVNIDAERLKFIKTMQYAGEGIDAFVLRLRGVAQSCDFKLLGDEHIKSQVVYGCLSRRVQLKATSEIITLQNLTTYARSLEQQGQYQEDFLKHDADRRNLSIKHESVNQMNQMRENRGKSSGGVKASGGGGYRSQGKVEGRSSAGICGMCGYEYPHKGECPAKGKICKACGGANHFSKVCRKAKSETSKKKGRIHQMGERRESDSDTSDLGGQGESVYSVFALETLSAIGDTVLKEKCPRVKVRCLDSVIDMGVDSQASVNALMFETYTSLLNRPILTHDISLTFSIDGITPIPNMGKFTTFIEVNGVRKSAEFKVFKGLRDNVLCWATSRDLGLINVTFSTNEQNIPDLSEFEKGRPDRMKAYEKYLEAKNPAGLKSTVTGAELTVFGRKLGAERAEYTRKLREIYPEVFSGLIGKLKGYELELHIDKKIRPVRSKERRIPFHLRDKVEAELDVMLRDDIIEFATGPTPWVSEMVIVPKPSNPDQIRITIDSKEANLAIARERHNTPSVEELAIDLNKARVISKADFTRSFYQIVIRKKSRYITTFRTSRGLMRFKRLSMGICCASEMFQWIIEKELAGLKGVKNLIDDCFIWGSSEEEHDIRVIAFLDRLKERGLTLNWDKCEFRQTELLFFGVVFSEKGIALNPAKVKALKEASPPNNVSELRSFLGIAVYCARAIPRLAELSEKLWKLVQRKTLWEWTEQHDKQFKEIKNAIIEKALGYFDKTWNTRLEVDASPVGAASILSQSNPRDEDDVKIITFCAIRSTTNRKLNVRRFWRTSSYIL